MSAPLVLVVDDDADIRETLCDLLADEGYRVAQAENGRDALALLARADQPRPDLILLDLMMPVMSGLQFHEALIEQPALASIPVVFLSADSRAREKLPPGVEYLGKPMELHTMLSLLRRHLAPGSGATG
jgi:CheY-like chemotaxis protein